MIADKIQYRSISYIYMFVHTLCLKIRCFREDQLEVILQNPTKLVLEVWKWARTGNRSGFMDIYGGFMRMPGWSSVSGFQVISSIGLRLDPWNHWSWWRELSWNLWKIFMWRTGGGEKTGVEQKGESWDAKVIFVMKSCMTLRQEGDLRYDSKLIKQIQIPVFATFIEDITPLS